MISLIVAAFKNEELTEKCIKSILRQTFENIEIILVDECASEKMKDVMGKINDERLKLFLFNEKNSWGVGRARNFGASKATGDTLLFTDSDAEMHSNFIEEIMKVFEEHDPDAISGLPVAPKREETDFLSYLLGVEYEARIRAIGEGFVSICSGTCFAVKKEAFEDIGGFIETQTVGEDWFFSQVAEQKGYKIWHTNKAKIIVFKWESFWKYLKKQRIYAKYRVYHAKKFKHTTDEYPLMKTDYSKYNLKEKIVFPFFWIIRASVWLLGMIFGIFYYVILRRSVT